MKQTTFDEFAGLATRGTFVPVCREIMADLLTPVSAFLKIAEHSDFAFLLESVEGGEQIARYSFLGKDPFLVIRAAGTTCQVERAGVTTTRDVSLLELLRDLLSDLRAPAVDGLPRFTGGAVGYLGYHAAAALGSSPGDRPVPAIDGDGATAETARFMLFDTVLAFDHVKHRILLIANARIGADDDLQAQYQFACAKVEFLERELERSLSRPVAPAVAPMVVDPAADRDAFEHAVTAANRAIGEGSVGHVVLSRPLEASLGVDAFALYRALRHQNPSPYMYFLRMGSTAIVGSSPEMLVRVEGEHAEMHPVAGTRLRAAAASDDTEAAEALRSDARARAGHAAFVDQARRDLEQVCEYGTVRVPQYIELERYSHVMHLASTIEGRLADGKDRFDVLAACFPAGTVSGSPRAAAMDLIAKLEPVARGLFGGAVGYMDFAGNLDFCTATDAIATQDGRANLRVGVGIGSASDPSSSFDETTANAETLLRAIRLAEEHA